MHLPIHVLALAAAGVHAGVIEARTVCSDYTIINTRGTAEIQGFSLGFIFTDRNVQKEVPGGKVYYTIYPASWDQDSTEGTADIVKKVTSTLASNPNECFILEGYSQGAAATTNALKLLTGPAFDAVKGVFLLGNPQHQPGLASNIDLGGGNSTIDAKGIYADRGGIPNEWISKTLDVCNKVSLCFLLKFMCFT